MGGAPNIVACAAVIDLAISEPMPNDQASDTPPNNVPIDHDPVDIHIDIPDDLNSTVPPWSLNDLHDHLERISI